jgi:hypothetical protein
VLGRTWAGGHRIVLQCFSSFFSFSSAQRERESSTRAAPSPHNAPARPSGGPSPGTLGCCCGLKRAGWGVWDAENRRMKKKDEAGERARARACSRLSLPPTSRPGDQAHTASSAFRTRRHTPRPSRAASIVVQSQATPQPTSGRTHGGTPAHKRERELEGVAEWAARASPPPPSRLARARLPLRRGRQQAADAAGEAWRGAAPAADGSALAAGGGHGWPRASLVRTRPCGLGRSHVRRQFGASSTALLRARAQHVFLFTDTQTTKK